MSDKFLNFSGLTHYDAKIKTWTRGRVDTVATSVSANTSNIQSLQTSVSGISQTTNELRDEVANLAQTVASGITTGSYQVDAIPQSGHTDHLVTSDGLSTRHLKRKQDTIPVIQQEARLLRLLQPMDTFIQAVAV